MSGFKDFFMLRGEKDGKNVFLSSVLYILESIELIEGIGTELINPLVPGVHQKVTHTYAAAENFRCVLNMCDLLVETRH